MFPFLIGIILLISLINPAIPKTFYDNLFSRNIFFDSIIDSYILTN